MTDGWVFGRSVLGPGAALGLCVAMLATEPAHAACKPEGPPMRQGVIERFEAQPDVLLRYNKGSPSGLSLAVTQLAAAKPASLKIIKTILPDADQDERAAIGKGLFAAASFCKQVAPDVASSIERGVLSMANSDVTKAYNQAEVLQVLSSGQSGQAGAATSGSSQRQNSGLINPDIKPLSDDLGLPNPDRIPEIGF